MVNYLVRLKIGVSSVAQGMQMSDKSIYLRREVAIVIVVYIYILMRRLRGQ